MQLSKNWSIAAEAEKTRFYILSKTEELKNHGTQESNGLQQFIDVKINQVIGVVREEGQ